MTQSSSPQRPPEPSPQAIQPRTVTCPQCGGDSVYAATNPSRPFCSERCKNVDFGAWASESFRVEVAPTAQDDADASAAGPTTH